MLVGVILLASAFVAVSLWLASRRRLRLRSWLGAFVLVAWVVGVGLKAHIDRAGEAEVEPRLAALQSIAWPASPSGVAGVKPPEIATALPDAPGPAAPAAPISSLIGGLQQRLAAHPDDASGWVLLAQSYGFMGDADAAEDAVRKAVALGVDERELRARVDDAMRGAGPR